MFACARLQANLLVRRQRIYRSLHSSMLPTPRDADELEWPSSRVRTTFLDYFCGGGGEHKHKFIKSSGVLPRKGAGTYFTNAGMNQFKSIILGELDADELVDARKYAGVANAQKCIRIGGKHNDLADIGRDTYHHTFFEMLGNWSFGTYDKERACRLALQLLVDVYKLDVNAMYFTYFSGDAELGLAGDQQTRDIWRRLGIPERQILGFGSKCNFWEMDTVGPCGPCTEIHYDRQVGAGDASHLVNAGTERCIEIWNIVFMTHNRVSRTHFTPLHTTMVDTGMGLERLTALLNRLHSNYDTDLFAPAFRLIHERCGSASLGAYESYALEHPMSAEYRRLSDYMRSITVSIGDGLVPSRNGLGGFLKSLILDSLRIVHKSFGVADKAKSVELLAALVDVNVNKLAPAYPELRGSDGQRATFIKQVIANTAGVYEAKRESWSLISQRFVKKAAAQELPKLSGEQVWRLSKGDGSGDEVDIDFIREWCAERHIELDMAGYDKLHTAYNDKAVRNNTMNKKRVDTSLFIELAGKLRQNGVARTLDAAKYSFDLDATLGEARFKQDVPLKAKVVAIFVKKQQEKASTYESVSQVTGPDVECIVVLDETSFYAEGGGQAADKGTLDFESSKGSSQLEVEHVINVKGYSFHIGKLSSRDQRGGEWSIGEGDRVECMVDGKSRFATSLNHTGLHLLNHAIRNCYGSEDSVIQMNSMVQSSGLKYEFKFNKSLGGKPTLADIEHMERVCAQFIDTALPVFVTDHVELDDEDSYDNNNKKRRATLNYPLRKLGDVLYPSKVRVVSVGAPWTEFQPNETSRLQQQAANSDLISAELCCGTHVANTSQLGQLAITRLEVVGDSSFEIEARTGARAAQVRQNDSLLQQHLQEMSVIVAGHNVAPAAADKLSPLENHTRLHRLADISTKISEVLKAADLSHVCVQRVTHETDKHRPSKNQLQIALKRYFELELVADSPQAVNAVVIAPIIPSQVATLSDQDQLSVKFLAFDSTMQTDRIVGVLKKIERLHPTLMLYNAYRGIYILYSTRAINEHAPTRVYFDTAQAEILASNKLAELVDTKTFYRVIRCPAIIQHDNNSNNKPKKNYFIP